MNLKVNLNGLILDNPIIAASGTFGYGLEFNKLYDINILGSLSCKGTTLYERYGNPLPRIAETKGGMINSVGLQNPGVDKVISHEFKELAKIYHKKIFANVGGSTYEEYIKAVERLSKEDIVGAIELNISCPNVKQGGITYGTDPIMAGNLVREVKKVSNKPVFVKLSPNVTDIVTIAKAVCDNGADGLSLINTLLGMRLDYKTGKPILNNIYGGVSGDCIFPVALRMVHQVYKAVKVPIIGMGGISSSYDVIEMMSAGASAVMIGSKNLTEPFIMKQITEELPLRLNELRVNDINEIIGRAHR